MHEAKQVRPIDPLPALERGRRQSALTGPEVDAFALGQLGSKLPHGCLVIGYGASLVGRCGWTREPNTDAPMISRRHEQKREEPARQGFGLVAKPLVDPAPPLLGQKDTTAVAAVCQVIAPRPPRSGFLEDRQVADLRILVPALGLDAATLFFRQRYPVLFATGAADVTIPVLHNRQMAYWQRHVSD